MHVLQLVALVTISWYGTMALHEAGHCAGARLSGGAVETVDIPLLGFSQTHYTDNPHPLLTTWAGPVGGALVALALFRITKAIHGLARHAILFFAGFSLIANGLYIGLGGLDEVGDCSDLLRNGASLWQLIGFGIASTATGFYAWHCMGPVRCWFTPQNE